MRAALAAFLYADGHLADAEGAWEELQQQDGEALVDFAKDLQCLFLLLF